MSSPKLGLRWVSMCPLCLSEIVTVAEVRSRRRSTYYNHAATQHHGLEDRERSSLADFMVQRSLPTSIAQVAWENQPGHGAGGTGDESGQVED